MEFLNINKEEGKEGDDNLCRLTINDFINDGPDPETRNVSKASNLSEEDRIRGVSQWQGKTFRGTNARISSKIFSAARNFRMNQIYKYEENTDYHFHNTFKYQTIFI